MDLFNCGVVSPVKDIAGRHERVTPEFSAKQTAVQEAANHVAIRPVGLFTNSVLRGVVSASFLNGIVVLLGHLTERFQSSKFSALVCLDTTVTVVFDVILSEEHRDGINWRALGFGQEYK